MSVHDHHEGLPGYSEAQILHDGCDECESRVKAPDRGIGSLDRGNFVRAWQRAAVWNRKGVPDLSHAERPMLMILWAVQCKLENRGIPIGEVPGDF